MKALKLRAQAALGVGTGRLLHSSGSILDDCARIADSRLQNGDLLTLQIYSAVQLAATGSCFAAFLGDGSVVTWGGTWVGLALLVTVVLCRIS